MNIPGPAERARRGYPWSTPPDAIFYAKRYVWLVGFVGRSGDDWLVKNRQRHRTRRFRCDEYTVGRRYGKIDSNGKTKRYSIEMCRRENRAARDHLPTLSSGAVGFT